MRPNAPFYDNDIILSWIRYHSLQRCSYFWIAIANRWENALEKWTIIKELWSVNETKFMRNKTVAFKKKTYINIKSLKDNITNEIRIIIIEESKIFANKVSFVAAYEGIFSASNDRNSKTRTHHGCNSKLTCLDFLYKINFQIRFVFSGSSCI